MATYEIKTHKGQVYLPLPTQLRAHQSRAKYRSYIGYLAAGKSLWGSVETLLRATEKPGYRPGKTLICRGIMSDLEDSTWATLRGVIGETCPGLIKDEHRSNHELQIILANGWEITGRHLGRYQAFGSSEPDCIWIDECNDDEVGLDAYAMLAGRMDRGRFDAKLWCTGNPAGRNWCYDLFFRHKFEGGEAMPDYEGFQPASTENIHLAPDYWDRLRRFYSPEWIAKFLEGSFDVFEGAILNELNPELHLVDPFEVPPELPRYRGLDHGINHPTACVWAAVDYDGNHIVYREHVKSDAVPASNAERILALSQAEEAMIQWTAIDPATRQRQTAGGQMAMIVDQYRDAGLFCRMADNSIPASIALLKRLLKPDPERVFPRWHYRAGEYGAPRLFVTRDCKVTWHQLQSWKWKAVKPGQATLERVVAKDDDTVAALRYLLMELPRAPEVKVNAPHAWLKKMLEDELPADSMFDTHYIGA